MPSRYEMLAANQERVLCVVMEKLRRVHSPVIGDPVGFEHFVDQNDVQKILSCRNALAHPSITDVDQVIIIMSCKDPNFSTTLIGRLIFSVCYVGVRPVLCVTKLDLIAEDDAIHEEIQHYISSGYEVYQNGRGYVSEDPIQVLKENISVLTEQSGVGKSSPLSRIDPTFHPRAQEISRALDRGKHTTRHRELHEIAGSQVTDIPSFFSLDFTVMNIMQLAECISDFQSVQDVCRFRDHIHVNEPDYAVRAAVEDGTIRRERYAHYLEIVDMMWKAKPRY